MPIHKGIFSAVSDVLSLADAVRRRVSGQRDVGMTWVNRGAYGTSPVVTGIGPLRRLATRPSAMPTTQPVGTSVIGDLACSVIPEGRARDICMGAIGTNGSTSPTTTVQTQDPCPEGYYKIPGTDTCINPLAIPPGGTPATVGAGGVAVVGAFGMPGISPSIVGNITKDDGSTGPILRCPSGMALAKDNICYVRSLIPRSFRKWNPGMRPLLTGGERKVLSRANTLRGKVKTLATASGFACKKKC
jgi:hypothetical protein